MDFLKQFIWTMVITQVCAVALLLLGGWAMDLAYASRCGETFFCYRLRCLADFPYWFGSVLLLMTIHGGYLFRLAILEGGVSTPFGGGPWGEYRVSVPLNPLKMVAVDLVVIPAILFLSVICRQHCW